MMNITTNWCVPSEIELYGTYSYDNSSEVANLRAPAKPKFREMVGVNAFEWDFLTIYGDSINETLIHVIENFNQVRHYLDWQHLQPDEYLNYTFNPSHAGGWNYDIMYQTSKALGIDILACIKTLPDWLVATYPPDEQNSQNVPTRYGRNFSDPHAYIEQARMVFQFAARYGSANVSLDLLKVNHNIRWYEDPENEVKTGLDVIKYIECDNERDKWWLGVEAFQTSYEYAADLSAFYDGHLNTMGVGAGAKNADPNVQIVMAGLASADPSYVIGMIEWSIKNRGYLADGRINLPFDIINYHFYSNNGYESQSGYSTQGLAPELSNAADVARSFVEMSRKFANNTPVWITETGYDIGQGSPYQVPPIGNKSVLLVDADWILRTALLYSRLGIARVFFYELYDDNPGCPGCQFATSGLVKGIIRRPSADYLYQANKLIGDFLFTESLSSDPFVDRYENAALNQSIYVMGIPDAIGREGMYSLSVDCESFNTVKVYYPTAGSNEMVTSVLPLVGCSVSLLVTETPIFVQPVWLTPSAHPTAAPTASPSAVPTDVPTFQVTASPSTTPTKVPSFFPSVRPTTGIPSANPTVIPSMKPSILPSVRPSTVPTKIPTAVPTFSSAPTKLPTVSPSTVPSKLPSLTPSKVPSVAPSKVPTQNPSIKPTANPSSRPVALVSFAKSDIDTKRSSLRGGI